MKIIQYNFRRLFSCLTLLIHIIKKIFGRGRQRKNSRSTQDHDSLPTSVAVDRNSTAEVKQTVVDDQWEDWGKSEEFSVKVEPADPSPEPSADDLFQDMIPVFKKTKKIAVKTKKLNNADPNPQVQPGVQPSWLNVDVRFTPAETELGTWTEESSSVWDDETVSERDIECQTEKIIKERKQAERDRRALEQQRKKEEKEALRMAKKPSGHLGVRLST